MSCTFQDEGFRRRARQPSAHGSCVVGVVERDLRDILAKIAVELTQAVAWREAGGLPDGTTARLLARGEGWIVEDVLCTSGPRDQPFQERHEGVSIAMVVAGSFQYRSTAGSELMTPGSLLLGDPGDERVAWLFVLGGAVCVAGAWLIRRAQMEPRDFRRA